ncbi:MAG: CoB--CoM heterodisulfide reductase iron-sulfur subunit B family protein [Bacteroidota bacterium]|nr:CoB--CoM heterodisulfide reductase iron-sulfur subunit B family protein [Bacteroidota bacterium]
MKIGLYPGCSLKGSSREYNESVVAIAKAFNIDLVEVQDWNCCGATAAHNLSKELSLALPARILALAEKEGFEELLVPCAACYSRLSVTQHELNEDQNLKNKIIDIIGMDYKGTTKIINVIQFIDKYITDQIEYKMFRPFRHDVACYYGCLMVRPHDILKFDRPEDPQSMDKVMRKIGANPIDWAFKTECCGAGFSVSRTDIVGKLSGKLIEDASDRGAELIIVACPMCHSNLDMRRAEIEKYLKKKNKMPVLYITQAIGLAIGLDEKTLGLQRHFVPVVLKETGDDYKAEKKEVTQPVETEE